MKLLIDCVPLSVGGGVQVAIGLLVGLRGQSSVEWAAVVPNGMRAAFPPALAADARITFVNRRSQADRFWLTPYLARFERRFSPDVVFTVFGPPFFHARAPHLVGFALPRLIYDRDGDMPPESLKDKVGDQARAALFRRADHIVVETEAAKVRLAQRIKVDPAIISVIPNGPNPLLSASAEPAHPPAGRFAILIPSAYYLHKNLEIVPRVAAALKRVAPGLDFVFRFTLPQASPDWTRIKAEADRLGVGKCLESLGVVKITDLAEAYLQASAVYLPTLREVSTAVYPESFLFKRPLVTTDLDFARELCGDGAAFADPRSPEAAAARLAEIAASPARAAELVEAGTRQLALAYPTPDEKFKMQMDLVRAVAESRTGPSLLQGRAVSPAPNIASSPSGPALGSEAAVQFHDNLATEWDAKYVTGRFRKRAEFFATEILQHLPKDGRWIDAGCGTGFFSRLLAADSREVIGVDASEHMIEAARDAAEHTDLQEKVKFEVIKTVEKIDFPSGSFDGAICLSVLEYLQRPEDCMEELNRILKPGGTVVISLPHRLAPIRLTQRAFFSTLGKLVPKKWEYATLSRYASTRNALRKTLWEHGFRMNKAVGFDSAMPDALLNFVPPSLLFVVATKVGTTGGRAP